MQDVSTTDGEPKMMNYNKNEILVKIISCLGDQNMMEQSSDAS